jgi:heptosyltransferase-2
VLDKIEMEADKILIFNVNWLGDVLFSTAVIRNIRYNFPDSYIACAIPERCRAVLEGNPHLNEIIIFDERGRHRGFVPKLRFISFLRSKEFDVAFLMRRSFTRALLCYLANIPERIGYYTAKRAWLLTKKIIPPDINSMHRIDYYLSLIEQAGLIVKDRFTEFFVKKEHEQDINDFFAAHGILQDNKIAAVNPGGNWKLKRWAPDNFSKLCDKLIEEFNFKVVLTGDEKDRALVEDIMRQMKYKAIGCAGEFNLKQTAALLQKVNVFISCDSGPLHIANAMGTPKIIAIFGPTSVRITGPYPPSERVIILQKDTGCKIPCYKLNCPDNRCMKEIKVQDVIAALR